MTHDESAKATRAAGSSRNCSRSLAGRAAERPIAWVVAGLVFLGNGLLSATRGDWWLAAIATATAILAGISALSVMSRPTPSTPHLSRDGEADFGLPPRRSKGADEAQ
jgi:hypothetical protein